MINYCKNFKNLCLYTLLIVGVSASAVNVLHNGDFKKRDKNGGPAGWTLKSPKKITMDIVSGGYNSPTSLLVKSPLPYGNRAALRQFLTLVAGREYEISCYAVGTNKGFLSFAFGNKWKQRLWLRSSKVWKKYQTRIVCNKKEFSWKNAYEVCLLVEAICDEKVSSACLRPLNALYSEKEPYSKYDGLYVVNRFDSFNLRARDIPSTLPMMCPELVNIPGQGLGKESLVKSSSDLSAKIAFATDSKGLIFYAKVKDNKHHAKLGANMWNGDSVQLGIDQRCSLKEGRNKCDREIGFSLSGGKISNFDWTVKRPLTSDEMQYTVKPVSGGYLVIARISWEYLSDIDRDGSGRFGVNVVVNDTDDGVNRKALSLAMGIYSYKSNKNNVICLLDSSKSSAFLVPENTTVTSDFSGRLILTGAAKKGKYSIRVIPEKGGKEFKMSLPTDRAINNSLPMVADLRIDGSKIEGGKHKVKVFCDGKVQTELSIQKEDYYNDFKKMLPTVKSRYDALKKTIESLAEEHKATERMNVACAIAERQFRELDGMMKRAKRSQKYADYNGRVGVRVCTELSQLLDSMDKDIADAKHGKVAPDTPNYVSSERTIKDGYLDATVMDSKGESSTRPVIFTGYGHFAQVWRDVNWFQHIGVNFMQIGIGPRIIKGENSDGSFIFGKGIKGIQNMLEKAWKSNVVISVLLSPHYFPGWALKKHPECAWNGGSFLRYDVQDPYAQKLMEAYLRKVISELRNSPGAGALHSFCLSNEPSMRISLARKQFRTRFIDYLKRKYKNNISKLNSAWRKSYQSFDDAVPHSDPTFKTNPGLYYEVNWFKTLEFAEWHAWMAKIIREEWPGVLIDTKQLHGMGLVNATDYELFGKFSDLNGCDASDSFTMGLMASMKPVSIVNTENHIVPDCHQPLFPYEKMYQNLFGQYMNGLSGTALWVWEPYSLPMFEKKHALDGNIYRRPMDIMAVYDASKAANRLIDEIKYGVHVKPEVAILYSTASAIDNSDYENGCKAVWYALQHTGHKAGFISEDQLKKGEFGNYKVIFAVSATNVKQSTVGALNKFVNKGGKVITVGHAFKQNPYGAPLKGGIKVSERLSGKLLKLASKDELLNKLQAILDNTVGRLPVMLTVQKGNPKDINWRCTPMKDGGYMVYIENIGNTDVTLNITGSVTDMILDKKQPGTFTLKQWGLKLLKVRL